MGPPKGREKAIAALTEALVTRHGTAMRDLVEAEVNRHVLGQSRLRAEDVDAIERSIRAAKRCGQTVSHGIKQGGAVSCRGGKEALSKSAPNLRAAAASSADLASPSPQRCPSSLCPGPPSTRHAPPSDAGSLDVSPSRARQLQSPVPLQVGLTKGSGARYMAASGARLVDPPWGVGASLDQGPQDPPLAFQAKHPVPLPMKQKQLDHWDLLNSFTAMKDREDRSVSDTASRAACKAVLDEQMGEVHARRQRRRDERQKDREDMMAKIQLDATELVQEQTVAEDRHERFRKARIELQRERDEQRAQQAESVRQEKAQTRAFLAYDKKLQEEEELNRQRERVQHQTALRSQMLDAVEAEAEKRKADKQSDVVMIKELIQQADDRLELNRSKVTKRIQRQERIGKTLGKELGERNAMIETQEEERRRKALEEHERATEERERSTAEARLHKVLDMRAEQRQQIEQKRERGRTEKDIDTWQATMWRQEVAEIESKDRAEKEEARQRRDELDVALVGQMRETLSKHRSQRGQQDTTLRDCALNRAAYAQMAAEGFHPELSAKLGQAQDRGKILDMGSVPRFDKHIDVLELVVG